MALGFTQLLRELSTGCIPGGKARPAGNSDDLTTIYGLTV
jgi:hypothetical protein